MDAVLSPNRSLSKRLFWRILAALAVVDVALAAAFVSQGAYPVVGFIILEVGLFWLAFRLNYAAGRTREFVRISAQRVTVTRAPAFGAGDHWQVSPVWAQVSQDSGAVRIASAGRALRLGAFLSPPERADFAAAVRQALAAARGARA